MKTIKIVMFLLIGTGIFVSSCKKDNEIIKAETASIQMPPFAVENNALYFESVEDYDELLEAWENLSFETIMEIQQDLGFKSMYAEYLEQGKIDDLPMDDDFLALILSPDAKITIENFTFTLDFEKEKVIAEGVESKSYEEFGFNDDITSVLFNGYENTKSCSQCRYVDDEYTQWTSEGDVFMEVEYNRYGIYYSLVYNWNGEGITNYANVTISMTNIYGNYSKCNSSTISKIKDPGMQSNLNKYKIKVYSGRKRLDQIHAYGTFKITDSGIIRYNKVMSISCH